MASSKNQNYLHGAAILTIAVIIIKILGAIYKIPLSNIMGKEGYAHFNVAYNLYNVLLTLSTAGLPVALAKLVSEANSLDRPNQVRRIFNVAMWAFVVLGLACSAAMLLFPTELAAFMGDVEASQSVFALAPAVVLVCIMSAFRGYTQGLSDMRPTSVSQVIEVAVKVVFGLLILVILDKRGLSTPLLSAGAISGVAVGSLAACLYMGAVSKRRDVSERLRYANSDRLTADVPDRRGAILKRLVSIGVPIALGSCVLSVITLVNTKLIYDRLQFGAGFSYAEANSMFGEYSMALTLYNLPAAFITPLTISVIPSITGFLTRREHKDARLVIESSLRIATIIALPMAVGLSVLAQPIMTGIYTDSGVQGGVILAILGVAAFFVCLALMTTAVLQASGHEKLPMVTMLIGSAVNVGLSYYLVGLPGLNIYGSAIGTAVGYVVMSVINLIFVMKKLPDKPKLQKVFVMPVINCVIMGVLAKVIYSVVSKVIGSGAALTRMETIISLVVAVGIAVIAYLVLTIVTQAITMEDMKLIPKGEKIGKLLHIK